MGQAHTPGRTATISDCGVYRYRLERLLSGAPKVAAFIMVNPSTADAEIDDQTIRKCIGFSKANGFGRFVVGNKFAFRAKDINALRDARDPVGPDNDRHLEEIMREADVHIAAWGSLSKLPETLRKRWHDIVRMSDRLGVTLHCIGVNDDKHPKHPQMTGYAVPVTEWSVPWFAGRTALSAARATGGTE